MRRAAAAAVLVFALAFAVPALASEQHPTQSELEAMLVCPTCHTTLDESNSPVAEQMKVEIRRGIAAGKTRSEIIDSLVGPPNNMGVAILGVPRKHGFDLLAWLLPFLGIAIGAVALGRGCLVLVAQPLGRRRPRAGDRRPAARPRARARVWTRSSRASMLEKLPVAFLAGLASVVTPCVLPLVPGYLSAVSSVDVDRLGERGAGRRVVIASIPFIIGFTIVFVALGAAAASVASVVPKSSQTQIAGFALVVIGLAFIGLIPIPDSAVAPGLLQRARHKGSGVLLGGAFAVCAAPCIGTVLASILVAAGSSGGIARGVVLLLAYSLGLGAAFVFAGVAFAHAMRAFRWVRSHYELIKVVSGTTLIVLGLLLFFNRDWWLRVALDQLLSKIGLGTY